MTISSFNEELKEEAQKWNKEYYELLEFRKNPTLGRNKCSGCIFSTDLDDPLFVGIGKVVARIVSNHCNNNNNNSTISNVNNDFLISYPCKVMNFFQCPFESTNNNQYPYTKEKLFVLQIVAFAIEQAISIFLETTKNNEIIYEVDFVNDRVQEIHTNYNGEPYSWGRNDNVKEQLSKVKPISKIIIRDEQDIYNILTNGKKLECLIEEYVKENNHKLEEQEICCDENTPCVNSSNKEKLLTNNILSVGSSKYQVKYQDNVDYLHKGENSHSKNTDELENENIKSDLKIKIKEELEKSDREQQILLKQNKQNIIYFLLDNKGSIRIEDLKIYGPIYKCYRQKENCIICNRLSNIICLNCNNYNKGIWLCADHWKQHAIENHDQQW
ncbi:MAG TPA: hypothetical protein VFP49_10315 [Nitrososphaeraceae archaeon]|nr:hypothetical protein [Nitrososphaeraceae archaeon]